MQQEEIDWGGDQASFAAPERSLLGSPPSRLSPACLKGEVIFASAEEQAQRSAELLGAGAIVVTLPPPTTTTRGRLGEVLEELVERELARHGAPSPYLAAWSAMPEDAEARLADQLFRARTLGGTGLAIAMGSLAAIGLPALTTDDSATLRWLARATVHAPLVLLVDDADLTLVGYAPPVPLAALVTPVRPAKPKAEQLALPDEPIVVLTPTPEIALALPAEPAPEPEPMPAPEPEPDPAPEPEVMSARAYDEEHEDLEDPDDEPRLLVGDDATNVESKVAFIEPRVEEAAPPPEPPVAPRPELRREPPAEPRAEPRRDDAWRTWTTALTSARGAQPLAMFERLFAESYMPLANAIADGLDDTRALRAHDEFRRSFERSYTDAFATFGATNRRPKLVMDAFDLAAKQARLANARVTHVLVVDSLRYDLGGMVRDALAREAAGVATLTSELVLWSALPTTTMRQLETLARGMDALRAPAGTSDEPAPSLRGRAAEAVRRLRVGSRELYKLDIVPALIARAARSRDGVAASLEAIAEATAEAIARHVSTLPARTLLYVVGDHGFAIDRRGDVHAGGASPEEVLVPAHAWLVGDLH